VQEQEARHWRRQPFPSRDSLKKWTVPGWFLGRVSIRPKYLQFQADDLKVFKTKPTRKSTSRTQERSGTTGHSIASAPVKFQKNLLSQNKTDTAELRTAIRSNIYCNRWTQPSTWKLFLRNFGFYLQVQTALQPRRQTSTCIIIIKCTKR
jgi:hypothetical protein